MAAAYFAGQDTIIPVTVVNTKRRASYSLLISEQVQDLTHPSFFILQLDPQQEVASSYRMHFPRRGVWRSQGYEITTTFPFELFRKGLEVFHPEEILVFPRPIPPARLPHFTSRPLGEIARPTKGNTGDFRSLREYRSSDSMRHVHWKVSAKRDQLVIRELEGQALDSLIVCFYNSWHPYPYASEWICEDLEQHRQRLERGVEACAGLIQHLINRRHPVALVTLQDRTPYGNSALHMEGILKLLARLQFVGEPDSPTLTRTLAFDLQPQDRCILMAEGPVFPEITTGQVVAKIPFG
ncbi:MAG: DUF58 domain-containing protein [Synechococcaceae cyanobacterium SM2_3_1]|nr:DUF58 domain-containing protein [Synechococcaceae cyanobacterium SM2_3_1]